MTTHIDRHPDPASNEAAAPFRLVVVNGGTSDPSSTRMLADRLAGAVEAAAARHGREVNTDVLELRELAGEIGTALVSQLVGPGLERAAELLGAADGAVVATPVYKAEPSGLFSSFFHVLDSDLLLGTPVVLAATAGTARHALVVDGAMRSLFAFLRTLIAPTGVFASTEDWNVPALTTRIDRAAFELFLLMDSGFANRLRADTWSSYQHTFRAVDDAGTGIDLGTDLMRLATGGSAA
ncbi:NADH-dependent FMN reductase [Pseudoclavibacter chungangensis]|uniref:NADH-dependent FMN reductase n=1 Tax=Pseudoclavibacter chungangensis TaxID=587635 RepID=A0A7J5BZI1_9MICO|nr:CE1759 family FMN reductase [Pseudoclavibacter chungangensis]KAB1660062.1 NADH-dependent FMN reductase [Pseudoclavibacter chungangensis]NYJ66842.1 FMN reductase [Pseudoclavibacter chungangensis]